VIEVAQKAGSSGCSTIRASVVLSGSFAGSAITAAIMPSDLEPARRAILGGVRRQFMQGEVQRGRRLEGR